MPPGSHSSSAHGRRRAHGLAQVNVILKVGSLEEMNKPVLPTQISQCEQDSGNQR